MGPRRVSSESLSLFATYRFCARAIVSFDRQSQQVHRRPLLSRTICKVVTWQRRLHFGQMACSDRIDEKEARRAGRIHTNVKETEMKVRFFPAQIKRSLTMSAITAARSSIDGTLDISGTLAGGRSLAVRA